MQKPRCGRLKAVALTCGLILTLCAAPAAAQSAPPVKPSGAPPSSAPPMTAPPSAAQPSASQPSAAQPGSAPDKPRASTRSERRAAQAARRKQMMERDAVLRKKRAACLAERKERKIPIFERPRFIRECMAR